MKLKICSPEDMQKFGINLASKLIGGSIIELVGDVGAGKTTLVKGVGKGLGVDQNIQSPSYTIFCSYKGSEKELHHYDFYRLQDPGIVSYDLEESLHNKNAITVVEWADTVQGVLPTKHIKMTIKTTGENERTVEIEGVKL